MRGSSTTCITPKARITANHNSMIGPKKAPTFAVPRDCTRNSPSRMTTLMVITTPVSTEWPRLGMVRRPSMALSTEIAGVITASP